MHPRRLICQSSIAAFLAALASLSSAQAQVVWDGETDNNWSTITNWDTNLEPTLTDAVTFPAVIPATGSAITLSAGELAASLNFLNSYTLSGGDLTLGATTSIGVDSTFTTAIGSAIGGAATSLTKSGGGTLVLSGTNTYTGKTIISGGTLSVGADNNLGAAPGAVVSDQLTLAGGTLKLTAGVTFASNRGFTATSGANAIDGNGFTTLFNGPVGLLNAGTSLTFTTTSGTATTFTLAASPANAPGTASVSIDPNVTLNLGNGGGTGNIGGNTAPLTINAGGTLRFNRNNNTSYNQDISGGGQVTIASITGQVVTLNPTNANTYAGGTFFSGSNSVVLATKDTAFGTGPLNFVNGTGTVASSSATARTYANSINITGAAGTVTFGQSSGGTGVQTFNGDVTFERGTGALTRTLSTAQAVTFNGVISDTGSNAVANTIAFSGSGTRVLRGANTFAGAVSWNSGNVTIAGPEGSIMNVPTITVGDNGGADESITVGNVNDVYATAGGLNRLGDTATLVLNGAGPANFNGPAAGSTGFTETFGTLSIAAGRGLVTVTPTTGQTHALSIATLTRAGNSTLFLRGNGLGGTGADTTTVTVGNAASLLVGGSGAAGTPTVGVIPFAVGDASSTGGGSGFLTNDATAGLRLLTAAEYDTTIAGADTLRNVTTAGGETVSSDVTINALRLTGGTTSIDTDDQLRVNSGAVLFTAAGTLGGAGTVDFGAREGIIQVGNTTAGTTGTINARLSGTGGLTVGSTGANNIIVLAGDNTTTGNLTINTGATVRLGSSTALNDNVPMAVVARAGAIFQLFGNNATLRNLAAGNAFQGVINNGATTAATLTTYLTASQTYGMVLANGGSGALSLVASAGPAQILTFNNNNTFTGSTEIRTGAVQFSGNNTGSSTSTSYALNGGTLRITNTSGNLLGTRISDTAPITMNAGAIELDNSNTASTSYSETVGPVTAASGANTITADKAASGSTSTLTLTSLTRSPGATVHFRSENAGTQSNDLGTTSQNRVLILGTVPNDDGILGGWATVDTATSREFATYGANGVTALTGQATTLATGANPTQNVRITASPAALTGNTEINSLNIVQAAATAVDIGAGNTLRVESGGVIVSGAFGNSFSNGTLTAGNGAAAGGDLIFTVNTNATSTVSSVIADNSATPGTNVVNLIKASTGTLVLSGANTYSGKTFINGTTVGASGSAAGGALRITADNNLGTAPASFVSDAITISGSSTLDLTTAASFELNANRGIVVGANANIAGSTNVISIGAGTAGNGKTLTYNGAINGVSTSEGSLHLKSNLTTTNIDPGKFVGTLSALNLGGSLRFDAGTISVSGANSVIGRGLQVGTDGPASLTYTSVGGSLAVGKGINATDVLEIGVVNVDPTPSNSAIGTSTLNVSALTNFTANVDTIRMGIGGNTNRYSRGVFIGATNNDITAATSILMSRSPGANSSGVGANSTMTFGSGINNLTTPLMNVAEFKGEGTVNIAAGGTLNIGGFGANTMNLNVGNNAGNTGTISNGTVNTTGGVMNGSFNNLVIGSKSGGGVGGATGTFTVTGTDNEISANSVTIATVAGNTSGTSQPTNGTLNFGGGSFIVNNDVSLATIGANTSTTPASTGRLNITGGTFHLGGNITRTTTDEARSNAFVTIDGGTLNGLNPAADDTTQATITASQLAFRSGAITNIAGATLAATSGTNSGVAGTTGDALILRDTNVGFAVNLTGATGGNVHYEAAGGGAGGTISGALDLGTVVRNINVENSAGAGTDLEISGSISGVLGGINKNGAGTLALSGVNSFTGGTTVSGGSLIAPLNGTLGAGDVSILNTAITLSLGAGVTDAIADTATLSLAGGGIAGLADAGFATLNSGVNETVAGLLLAGAPQANGTYGAVGSGAQFENDEFFSGTGIVTVIPEPGSAVMLLAGLGSLFGCRRLRRRQS